jgi:hypothetical protein
MAGSIALGSLGLSTIRSTPAAMKASIWALCVAGS